MRHLLLFLLLLSSNLFALGVRPPQDEAPFISPPPKDITVAIPKTFYVLEDVQLFEKISFNLRHTKELDIGKVTFLVQGQGGVALYGQELMKAIKAAQENGAIVNMRVIGPAYSMHAYITCVANKVELEDGAAVMFHGIATQNSFLYGLIQYEDRNQDPSTVAEQDWFFRECKKTGRLNDEQITAIKEGKTVTIARFDNELVTTIESSDDGYFAAANQLLEALIAASLGLVIVGLAKRI